MTTYRLTFRKQALKEWRKLNQSIRDQIKKRLAERLENPRVESAKLSGLPNAYKIKLRSAEYRLVYEVHDDTVVVSVVAIGRRERNAVYRLAEKRLD